MANATANHRVGDREADVESTLATRNLTVNATAKRRCSTESQTGYRAGDDQV